VALLPELLAVADLPSWAREIALLRRELTETLERHGLAPHPSDANFVLCPAPPGFRDRLLAKGVIVRDCASFGLPTQVRIAVPDHEGIERLASVLNVITP
jgi:histidinol-phosphate/aromatic aminotransferase/cobyric acid decarboxylase-like protein